MTKIDESKLTRAIGAAAVAGATIAGINHVTKDDDGHQITQAEHENETKRMGFKAFSMKQQARALDMASTIQDKYKSVDDHTAMKIANLAIKYEKPTWPKAEDILAVCGIESSMKPEAQSKLKKDPAIGLMQVRAKIWGLNPNELKHNIEHQIKVGSQILNDYYKKVGNVDGALQAYNVGLTNYMKKKGLNPRYVPKFDKERAMYESMYGNVLLEATKAEAIELQQWLIDANDRYTYKVKKHAADSDTVSIDVMWKERLVAQIDIGSLEPFNVTVDFLNLKASGHSVNGFSAWNDRQKFEANMTQMLNSLEVFYEREA